MKNLNDVNWRFILIFSFLGPFIGAAAFLLVAIVQTPVDVAFAKQIPIIIASSYMFGIVPALVTGLITLYLFNALAQKVPQLCWMHTVLAAIVGACVSFVFYFFVVPSNVILLFSLGAFSAFVCSFIYWRL